MPYSLPGVLEHSLASEAHAADGQLAEAEAAHMGKGSHEVSEQVKDCSWTHRRGAPQGAEHKTA